MWCGGEFADVCLFWQVFAERIDDTNKLLDIYIDLLRQAEKTQTLLTDPEWKGATEVSI